MASMTWGTAGGGGASARVSAAQRRAHQAARAAGRGDTTRCVPARCFELPGSGPPPRARVTPRSTHLGVAGRLLADVEAHQGQAEARHLRKPGTGWVMCICAGGVSGRVGRWVGGCGGCPEQCGHEPSSAATAVIYPAPTWRSTSSSLALAVDSSPGIGGARDAGAGCGRFRAYRSKRTHGRAQLARACRNPSARRPPPPQREIAFSGRPDQITDLEVAHPWRSGCRTSF